MSKNIYYINIYKSEQIYACNMKVVFPNFKFVNNYLPNSFKINHKRIKRYIVIRFIIILQYTAFVTIIKIKL